MNFLIKGPVQSENGLPNQITAGTFAKLLGSECTTGMVEQKKFVMKSGDSGLSAGNRVSPEFPLRIHTDWRLRLLIQNDEALLLSTIGVGRVRRYSMVAAILDNTVAFAFMVMARILLESMLVRRLA